MADTPKPDQLGKIDHMPPLFRGWMNEPAKITPGVYCYAGKPKNLDYVGMPNAREWNPVDDDWKLPENWQEIILDGIKERLEKFRSFKLFMDICVRCGACADKCHFFIGSGDPKNMPVLRAELLRSIYRKNFTVGGKIFGILAGARELTEDVLKELWYYLYQCTECRRCSLFCPYGIDTAEITMMGRELTNLLGLNIDWISAPVANCYRTGNHLGIQPHAFFGYFTSHEMAKRLNAKMYAEAKRLGVKWILGGECGHMWRVLNQYMDTWNGPADFLEEPVSPITGTKFENAKALKMVHITEFTADLIKHNKLKLDPSRNDHLTLTYHDSCNTARGMGLFEEPRYIINNVCNSFYEMPPETIREQTFCCGSGSGLNAGENMELRMRGGLPRANAAKHVHEKHGVNMMACVCAIDRAALTTAMEYWVPGVNVTGVHELVGNALVFEGEGERTTDLRGEPLAGMEEEEDV
jgi:Fe-S oxidoreductase